MEYLRDLLAEHKRNRPPRGTERMVSEGIDANVYLRTQAAARTPDRLIFAPPFFAPAAY